jgi:site-specific recombinase XerD
MSTLSYTILPARRLLASQSDISSISKGHEFEEREEAPHRYRKASHEFINSLRGSGRAPSTLKSYEKNLRLIGHIIKNADLHNVTGGTLTRAMVYLAEGQRGNIRRSASSMNQIRSVARSFFSWAVETGKIRKNPAADIRLAKAVNARTMPITEQELDALFDAIRLDVSFTARRDEALFALYAFSGARRSEVLSLRVNDLELHENRIWFSALKTNGGEYRAIPNILKHVLAAYLMQRAAHLKSLHSDFVFPGRSCSGSLSARMAHLRFNYWKRAARLRPALTLNSFRSGFASRLYHVTSDAILVSHAMGHKHLSSVMRYILLGEGSIRSALEKAFP